MENAHARNELLEDADKLKVKKNDIANILSKL